MIATLAAIPALAAPAGKAGDQRRGNPECTYEAADKRQGKTKTHQDRTMDCIVVKGYPNQDGRAELRRSLQEEAKQELSKAVRPDLKATLTTDRTS
jgi:hypothetical protein